MYKPSDTAPPMWAHQKAILLRSAHLAMFAIFAEQRTGKCRIIIDTGAYQYETNVIDAILIVAWPSAVPGVWVDQEVPQWMPKRIPYRTVQWKSSKADSKDFNKVLKELLTFQGLSIFAVNCEALVTAQTCWAYLQKFTEKRRVMFVADESGGWCGNPGSARAKRGEALARRCVTKRILDGQPVAENPFEIFAQCNLLQRGILGYTRVEAFRARYGKYEVETDARGNPILDQFGLPTRARFKNYATGGEFYKLIGYQNLDELRDKLLTIGSRVLRKDCADIPEKLYEQRRFKLSVEQRRVYDELESEYRATIDGTEVEVRNALARDGRLAMLARGWWPPEKTSRLCLGCGGSGCATCDGQGVIMTDLPRRMINFANNPALDILRGLLEIKVPTIVWCRHRFDVLDALNAARNVGCEPCRYDGAVKPTDRDAAKAAFQDGIADTLVGTPASAGMGVRLDRAERIIFYSQNFSRRQRSQSEDRAEGLTKKGGTLIVDLVAEGTIDEHVLEVHRGKRAAAAEVMGDTT